VQAHFGFKSFIFEYQQQKRKAPTLMVSAFIFMAGAEGLEPSARGFGANRG